MKKNQHNVFMSMMLALAIVPTACVEPFEFESESFERALVIEARITDEMVQHEVKLSTTHQLDEDGPNMESNAMVFVKDDMGAEFDFDETQPGTYKSVDSFAVQAGRSYQLNVRLGNGRTYTSTFEATPPIAQIDRVYGDRTTNAAGFDGLSIFVDASNVQGDAQYFRYQYEETYKLVVPEWKPFDTVVLIDIFPDCFIGTALRSQQQVTCFVSPSRKNANVLNINSTNSGVVQRHAVRFISDDNYKMASRYSILVRQLVQTRDANAYFETLDNFSASGSLFSQLQTGYIQGNITSESNSEERVIGFFEVSTLAEKRYFFNYADFYAGELPPPYFVPCEPFELPDSGQDDILSCGSSYELIKEREILYHSEITLPPGSIGREFMYVNRWCGDCTAIGTPEIPDFWKE